VDSKGKPEGIDRNQTSLAIKIDIQCIAVDAMWRVWLLRFANYQHDCTALYYSGVLDVLVWLGCLVVFGSRLVPAAEIFGCSIL